MCGRFTFAAAPEIVAELFELREVPELTPRYNVAPTQLVATVLCESDPARAVRNVTASPRSFRMMRWGLIPSWADDPAIGSRMINARAETLSSKPAFRSAFKRRRCLILADGFYEWKKLERRKQPYHIRLRDGTPFAFAGLWERWSGADGVPVDSCTVITTEPNELLATVHDRMPVILNPVDYGTWLSVTDEDTDRVERLLRPYAAAKMEAYPVSTMVNSPSDDNARCIERLVG